MEEGHGSQENHRVQQKQGEDKRSKENPRKGANDPRLAKKWVICNPKKSGEEMLDDLSKSNSLEKGKGEKGK